MTGTFTNQNMDCLCAKIPEDDAMLILSPKNVLLAAHHKDCPEHGWTTKKNAPNGNNQKDSPTESGNVPEREQALTIINKSA